VVRLGVGGAADAPALVGVCARADVVVLGAARERGADVGRLDDTAAAAVEYNELMKQVVASAGYHTSK
jgi:hypothetical protein